MHLSAYILKRIASIPIILFILSILIFSMVLFLSPSERVAVFVSSPDALQNTSLDDLIRNYGLDQPVHVQYARWIKGVLNRNLGWSTSARMPVSEALAQRVPATIELLLAGQVVVFFGGIWLGTLSAARHNRLTDHLVRVITTIGISIPEFVVSLLLLILFYVTFDLFAPGRLGMWATDAVYSASFVRYTGLHLVDSLMNRRLDVFLDALKHLVLPTAAYAAGGLAVTARLMRASLLENLSGGYVDTARLKGLADRTVMNRHVRRNAMLPVITLMGMRVPVLLSGSVIVETIFNYPGMGMLIVTAAQGLDFPTIIAASLMISIIIIISNLVVDILYTLLNPMIRVG